MAATTHQVRQRPALRALALSALLMLVGLVLVLMAELLDRNLLLTVGGLLALVLGAGLFGASWWVARAARMQVVLDEDGYAIQGRDSAQSRRWADVRRVTSASGRLTLFLADGTRVLLAVPRGRRDDFDALGADIARRLDQSRGYRA